jgi:glutamate synthase domain-containing protein 2
MPTIEIYSLLYNYLKKIDDAGGYVPTVALAGGCTFEDQIFKALALGSPYVKLAGMARSPIAAAMVGKTIGKAIDEGQLPVYIERFGRSKNEIFITSADLRKELGHEEFEKVPTGALGLYTYYERLAQGLRQLMAGSRKFAIEYITRDDIAAITREAADITGIDYVMDVDKAEAEEILQQSLSTARV